MAKKTTAKKTAAKKAAGTKKKAAAKKGAKATANKTAAKKSPKKAAPKKVAAKKSPPKKAAAKKQAAPKKGKSLFNKKFLEQQKALLLDERARYTKSADSLRAEAEQLIESREPGDVQFDEESGEGDTLAVERERDLALSAQAMAAVEQIDEALERIVDGTYGICMVSGEPIPEERLEAIPWAAERVEHKAGGFGRR